jgi:hypothetical protein
MKTVGVTICLNEIEYLELNVRQHYDFVDRWIIVEGADVLYPRERVTGDGLSTDGTSELLMRLVAKLPKLEYVPYGWAVNKCELRNVYAARIMDQSAVIVFDADEFLTHESLRMLKCGLNEPGVRPGAIRLPHVHFWKQPDQIIVGGYYDVPHDRAYVWPAMSRYLDNHNHPCWLASGGWRQINDSSLKFERALECREGSYSHDLPAWLHFGFAKRPENIADKNAYYLARGEASTRPGTTRDRAAWFAEQVPDGCKVLPWGGKLPEIMRCASD